MSNNQVVVVEKNIVDKVANRVKEFQARGELVFPENYIPENAMKSAWLTIQEVQDKNYKPALEVCTNASISNALLSMAVQGLNPDKAQCYFIVRGKKLCLQRSYFGSMHVAKTVDPSIQDIYGQTVYEDDDFEYEIKHGKHRITKHAQKLSNVKKDKIAAVYGTILYKDGRELSEVMTFDQVKQAWEQSPMKPVDDKGNINPKSTHGKFTSDMAEKTVINKVCKYIINSSSDSNIVAQFAKKLDSEIAEAEVQVEIDGNANQEYLDFETGEIIDGDVVYEEEPEVIGDGEQATMEGPGY